MIRHHILPAAAGLTALIAAGCSNPYDFATQSQHAHSSSYGAYGSSTAPYYPAPYAQPQPDYMHASTAQSFQKQGFYGQNDQSHNAAYQGYAPQTHAPAPYGAQTYANQGYYARTGGPQNVGYRSTQLGLRGSQTPLRSRINLNYETLNFFEAPLAKEIGDTTFLLRGRIDTPLSYSLKNGNDFDAALEANYQISAETQLPNRITLGAIYAGRGVENNGVDYDDQIAAYAGGSWGTVFGGNVSNLVFENTRRKRGASTLELEGSTTLGTLAEWSGGYQGRYGPAIVSALIDEDDNYDIGVSVQRPMGNKDYRFTARHNTGQFTAADGVTEIDTRAISAVGEYVYGSTRYDIGVGYEDLENGAHQADRWFTSAGISTKKGVWSLSAEGHIGEIDGQSEKSALIGVRYDIARGLAASAALDYQDRVVAIDGVNYINTKDTRAVMALSYGF